MIVINIKYNWMYKLRSTFFFLIHKIIKYALIIYFIHPLLIVLVMYGTNLNAKLIRYDINI